MNVLVAPNTMKGSLTAADFASAVEKGLRSVSPVFVVRKIPVADGGDFTGQILAGALSAGTYRATVKGPSGRKTEAEYAISGRTAIITMSEASGLKLLNVGELDPLVNTTFGTGELIKAALDRGCRKIILGIGGSATIDGGIGMLEALGFSFTDGQGKRLAGNPLSLQGIKNILFPEHLPYDIVIHILADVNNPLLGPNGAVAVFGPQKGAGPENSKILEAGLGNWITVLENISGRHLRDIPGMGAAGGMASGLAALMGARILPGARYIFDILGMEGHISWADRIVTGEGRIDSQTLGMKAPEVLARMAADAGKPVTAIAGSVHPEATASYDSVWSLCNDTISTGMAMEKAGELVLATAVRVANQWISESPLVEAEHQILDRTEKLIRDNRTEEAAGQVSVLSNKETPGFWYLTGRIAMKQQKWGDALNAYRKCLEKDPGHPLAPSEIEILRSILNFRNPDLLNP